jgi:hypothetical protein
MANISAQASTKYTLTAQDIVNGWATVHMTWPSPFYDTNYTPTFCVEDLSSPIDLSFEVGDIHNMTPAGLDAIVYLTAAIPILQGQTDLVNTTNSLAPITLTAPITTLYQVTFYYGPATASGSGTWTPAVSWTDPSGNVLVMTGPYLGSATAGSVENYQSYSIPYFAKAGTPITVTGAYSGAAFPMNVSIRVVQMPNSNTIPVAGEQFVVHAMASHR